MSEQNYAMAIGEFVTINLVLNVEYLDAWVGVESFNVNFIVEMTNISNDSVVFHLGHMLDHDNILVTGGSDVDVSGVED